MSDSADRRSPDGVGARDLSTLERAFYGEAAELIEPGSVDELRSVVRELEADGRVIVPAGVGTHAHSGNPPPAGAAILSTRRLDGIARYEPDDFTIGVEAGVRLGALRDVLAENGQELPVDWSARAAGTIGGWTSTSPPGPRRALYGGLREQIIGIHGVRSGGRPYKAGGMVVKNVAGYEVAKLLCGAHGTAGVVTRVNFKLRPLPQARAGARLRFSSRADAWAFATELRALKLEPAVLCVLDSSVLDGDAGSGSSDVLYFFEGNRTLVGWLEEEALRLLGAHRPEEVEALADSGSDAALEILAERFDPAPRLADGVPGDFAALRAAVLPTRADALDTRLRHVLREAGVRSFELVIDAATGTALVEWRGEEERLATPLAEISAWLREQGGQGWVVYLPASLRARWGFVLVDDPAVEVAKRVLAVFDPGGVFCPGRLLGS